MSQYSEQHFRGYFVKTFNIAMIAGFISLATITSVSAAVPSQGKVLVVMSGGHLLKLKDGTDYATGYYLNEVATPLAALVKAGYTPVFTNPNGDTPSMDASSNDDKFFGGDKAKRMEALRLVDSFAGIHHPMKLKDVVSHTNEYVGVFVPGGHAPMIDLTTDTSLGTILKSFHDRRLPTALICHGPMALLSTLPDAVAFNQTLVSGEVSSQPKYAKPWTYVGYRVAVFSKTEEQQIEAPQLGGPAPYYNDEALSAAGVKVENLAPWQPNVVQDRELITGQQPFSDHAFADAFVAQLQAKAK